jgi:lipopolysaccharide transport system ATP-binding protein
LRLAFAVAAHLEPDILIIDEVLAVGDIEFQNKCLKKMQDISNDRGRTVILVSHNMNHISSICTSGILLDKGKIIEAGSTNHVVSTYVSNYEQKSAYHDWPDENRPGNDNVRLNSVRVIDSTSQTQLNFKVSEKIGIEMNYEVLRPNQILWLGHNLYNQLLINVFDTHSVTSEYYSKPHPTGAFSAIVWIPAHLLNVGTYHVGSAIFNHQQYIIHLHERDVVLFNVYDAIDETSGKGLSAGDFPGVVRPLLEWSVQKI